MMFLLVSCVTMATVTVQLKLVGMFLVFGEFNIDTSHELTSAIILRVKNGMYFLVPGSKIRAFVSSQMFFFFNCKSLFNCWTDGTQAEQEIVMGIFQFSDNQK